MSAHPELVDLLALSSGQEASDTAAHAAHCAGCAGTVRELAELKEPVELEAELEAELEDLDFASFRRRDPLHHEVERLLDVALTDQAVFNSTLRQIRDHSVFPRLLVLLCQRATAKVPRNAASALRLAVAVEAEAANLASHASRTVVRAEALILASAARLLLGETATARSVAAEAGSLLEGVPDSEFPRAVARYYEATAASFQRDYTTTAALLTSARRTFAAYGQEQWLGRVLQAEATLAAQRGDNEGALPLFEEALRRLDPQLDDHVFVATLVNKASTLSHLGRMTEARAAYARALATALRKGLDYSVQVIRNGLAEIDFRRGDLSRALASFRRLAIRAHEAGYLEDYAFAQLYAAECLGRLGRTMEMRATLRLLKSERGLTPFDQSVAFDELFTCLDQGELDAGLVAHVREYLEARASGDPTAYRPLRARA